MATHPHRTNTGYGVTGPRSRHAIDPIVVPPRRGRAKRTPGRRGRADRMSALRGAVGLEGLGHQLGVHALADLLDEPVLEPKDPAVVVVVTATIGQLVAARVLNHNGVTVSVDVTHISTGRRAERLGGSAEKRVDTSGLPSNARDH